MLMKIPYTQPNRTRRGFILGTMLLLALPAGLQASAADVVKAQRILTEVIKVAERLNQQNLELPVPDPLPNNTGRYLLPVNAEGGLTEWATKSLSAQVGAAVGDQAGKAAGNALASRVPMGGMLAGAVRNKGKEMGAIAALGGMEAIKQSSSLSFDNLGDYALYLHGSGVGAEGVAAAMALYPELEKTYKNTISQAYRSASRAARK